MCHKISKIKNILNECIDLLDTHSRFFVKNPISDFTKTKKISFKQCISTILGFGGASLTNELIRFYNYDANIPTSSAFVQQRSKILPETFETLFHIFNEKTDIPKLFNGYRLLAVDGSDIHIPTIANDLDSHYHNSNNISYNLLHLNALYDLCSNTYVDAIIQKSKKTNEHEAFVNMVNNFASYSKEHNAIFIADRGYESYNNLAHVQNNGLYFLFRVKDIHSPGIASGADLPDTDEFDVSFDRLLTRTNSKVVKNDKRFKYLPSKTPFDFLPIKASRNKLETFNLKYRLVRIKISDGLYEMIATNLPIDKFPPSELLKLYSMRWGIETSFREIKYMHGLLNFHSKKVENIFQEIYAKLTMFNFTALIMHCVTIKSKNTKYDYHLNHAVATNICRQYFIRNISPHNVEATISNNLVPFRPNRSFSRIKSRKTACSFHYRIS